MAQLPRSLAAWGAEDFKDTLKQELASVKADEFPLQQGLTHSSMALDDELAFVVISAGQHKGLVRARVGIFYKGIIAGCNCADDPSPPDVQSEYCEVSIELDPTSAEAHIALAQD